jgi:hypothetical protein
MEHLIIDLAKIGLIIVAAAIAISAFIGTAGMNYDPYSDEFYVPLDDEDDDI